MNIQRLYRTVRNLVAEAPKHVRGPDLFGEVPKMVLSQNHSPNLEWSRYVGENAP